MPFVCEASLFSYFPDAIVYFPDAPPTNHVAATLCIVIAYFPDAPPSPPSLSHAVPKVAVGKGILQLLVHGRFWIVVAALAMPLGVLSAWSECVPGLRRRLFKIIISSSPLPQ